MVLPDGPSRHLDSALGGIGGSLVADPGAGLRWTPRQQRHVTLAFHGNVPDGAVPAYVDALARAVSEQAVDPFEVAVAGGGSFSGRTLWAGIGEGAKRLQKLSAIVEEAAAEAGFWPDGHAGARPHVTLAKVSSNRGEQSRRSGRRNSRHNKSEDAPIANLEAWAHALSIYRGPVWDVETIHVLKSELGKGPGSSPLHTQIAVIPLMPHLAANWDLLIDDGESATQAGRRLNYPLRTDLIETT